MQPARHNAASRNLCIAADGYPDICVDHNARPDTRRFGAIFPLEVPDAVSLDSGNSTEEEQNDSDDHLRFTFVAALDSNASITRVAPPASADESFTSSVAQQTIVCYHATKHDSTKTGEKEPQIPDDQRSMYTLATSTDTQLTMDMMWRPKPKIHMRRADQRALMQAQTQAIAMMHDAGLKPTNKIQCRRRGCADILPNVEALKYHLHIHNIADLAARGCNAFPSIACKPPSLAWCSTSNPETLKRNHSRSKSSSGTQRNRLTTSPLPRRLSAGSLLPSLFSSREATPEVPPAPSFTTVAEAPTPEPSPNELAGFLLVRNNETPSHASTPSHGRRKRKENIAVSAGTECSPSIAMLFSPPSSPIMRERPVVVPRAKLPQPALLCSPKGTENENGVSTPSESAYPGSDQLTGSQSTVRALSPTRAMSPIRNGIKRILSIGSPESVPDK